MKIQPLDKQIAITIKIIKLLEKEKFKYSEWDFVNVLLCDIMTEQSRDDGIESYITFQGH